MSVTFQNIKSDKTTCNNTRQGVKQKFGYHNESRTRKFIQSAKISVTQE